MTDPIPQAVVAVIVRQQRLLVIQRSEFVRAPGEFGFPGGGIEAGETEQVALQRELREELGVTGHANRHLWRSVTPWGVAVSWWTALLDEPIELALNSQEVAAAFWLTPEEMAAEPRLLQSNRQFLAALGEGEFELPELS